MKTRIQFGLLLGVLGAVMGPARIADAQVSLSTVVDLAQKNSSAVRVAEADVDKARAALSQARDVFVPSLTFGSGIPAFPEVGYTGAPPSIWNATVQSLVFSVQQKHYIDAARSGLLAAELRLKDTKEQVALDASTTYIEMDTLQQEIAGGDQQLEHAKRLVEIEQQRAEAGVDPLSEVLQAQLTAAQLRLAGVHLEKRASVAAGNLAMLTGLPVGSILPDHSSIPEIPQMHGDSRAVPLPGLLAARQVARSKQQVASGDQKVNLIPQLSFFTQYNRNTTILNEVNKYFKTPLPANNLSSGFAIDIPLFDLRHWAKARESRADALRATVEAEQAERQNDAAISELNSTLRELDAQAEVATLQKQIAGNQLKTVQAQLEDSAPQGSAQTTPKAEQLARVAERQKFNDALEADLNLAKARLGLLRALGHMGDWINELRPAGTGAR